MRPRQKVRRQARFNRSRQRKARDRPHTGCDTCRETVILEDFKMVTNDTTITITTTIQTDLNCKQTWSREAFIIPLSLVTPESNLYPHCTDTYASWENEKKKKMQIWQGLKEEGGKQSRAVGAKWEVRHGWASDTHTRWRSPQRPCFSHEDQFNQGAFDFCMLGLKG